MSVILNAMLFRIGFAVAWVKDIPHQIRYQYWVLRYGGKHKIPQHLQQRDLKSHVKSETIHFIIAHMAVTELTRNFNVSISKLDAWMIDMYKGGMVDNTALGYITKVIQAKNQRRAAFDTMVQIGDIPQHRVDFMFPKPEDKALLNEWLDGEGPMVRNRE